MKRPGDTTEQHLAKIERKRRQLVARGWSEARIHQYLKDWAGFDPRTDNKRMNDAKAIGDIC